MAAGLTQPERDKISSLLVAKKGWWPSGRADLVRTMLHLSSQLRVSLCRSVMQLSPLILVWRR